MAEQGGKVPIRWDEGGLAPAICQDARTGQILMLAYMNEESLQKTQETGLAHFWSRSRGRLWKKGESSGNLLAVKHISYDCDSDTLLLLVEPSGPACHTGRMSCFFQDLDLPPGGDVDAPENIREEPFYPNILERIYSVIEERKRTLPQGSYVATLFREGEERILGKLVEEASEVILAAKERDPSQLAYEVADLWFHSLLALSLLRVPPGKVFSELRRRYGRSGLRPGTKK
ncbi:MAG: bifunctional phosphoribosyl-AMP cyclohydrolase/phosphoribosyl-ATP diphosphatase HisIE [Nitrospinota bacterium]